MGRSNKQHEMRGSHKPLSVAGDALETVQKLRL